VKVIKFCEQNRNCALERAFFVNESHIHYWCKQKEALCEAKCNVRAFRCPKIGKFSEREEKLFKYFEETHNSPRCVSRNTTVMSAWDSMIAQKEGLCVRNAVLGHSRAPKLERSLSLKTNYLNASEKHRTTTTLDLTKCYSYERLRQRDC
jgi:hypothetical protein